MMNTDEKMVPSFKNQVEEDQGEIEEEDGEEEEEGGEKSCDDGEEEEGRDDTEKKVEVMPQATDEDFPLAIEAAEKKPQVLNLNNEVVNMRKEVRRVRVLIIRKLTRKIAALKKKKGKEEEVERNQRRAARLLEEVHSMKNLSPDLVTKTALQKSLNFEQVCKNPKSTISDRAVARIATHPQFNKKIESIKAAVKAFKEERVKGLKQEGKAKVQKQAEKQTLPSQDKKAKIENKKNKRESTLDLQETADNEERIVVCKNTKDAAEIHKQAKPDSTSVKSSGVKDVVKNEPQSRVAEKISGLPPASVMLQKREEEDESDVEPSDDEEKEYFDDSTEERFHKQSSQSEESDDEDDFFVGKMSKFKKKKQKANKKEEEDKGQEVKKDSTDNVKTSDKLQSELDELETRLKSRATSLQSVFCSSLTGTKAGRGSSKGRGGGKFMAQGKPKSGSGPDRDFSKHVKFQNKEQGASNVGFKYSKPCPESTGPQSDERVSAFAGRGRGRGRGNVRWEKSHSGGGVVSHQSALHPSWEASKKRKEQQGQIMAFQGKKIKFDDDD
ncbi:serum response factor-binding protein 1 [Melanotaenia boesemani]|uniref:serum response factor-binding protein 1 n=1 Tax=Melanotaenia boesemani TaxID=1250792 RepID=UPI001C043158|nr:serum response factor-binding protein 1 [Melanotaenia boesemani]